ncbi:hypothetical protein ASPZODRAFT_125317 [Penicilliopsis zonata CBS 506.65]|uniref:Uncharacterized protein n=1 Tax=Penicilliopsis zonata CBS 506.65 TaxID=1073090 RepID=A0A1L9S5Z5_9EURO|nr:hypothetical protein ASPZODRAFT_125317 [Penicilliopsis zonata CBS 506.65]OJJ42592.1 hypothetical protein ASPZODRAFT_125317 [Penicilliopsis zonata CBS 506.65]
MDSSDLELFFHRQWKATIEQCEKSLEPDDLVQVQSITSWDSIQKHVWGGESARTGPHEIALIRPTLGHLHRFTRIFETQLAPGLQADYFWGIIGVLLELTAQDPQALSKIPRMLKSLGYKAEAFISYYAVCKDNREQIKEACFDIQVQLVEFFTGAVKSMRGEEDKRYTYQQQEDPWLLLQRQFTSTNQELLETIARVEKLIAVSPSGLGRHGSSDPAVRPVRCMILPSKKTARFFDRVETFEKIDRVLGRVRTDTSFRSIALFGLGGIGKSSIAARYIEKKIEEDEYDAVFWVYGEKTASLRQSFTDIAMRLKLQGAQPNLHDENLILVQNWFQSTDCRWLVVYDNVESTDLLMPYWPEASHGKAIITTRNHSLAYEPATSGLEITSWDAQTGSQFLLFLLKHNIGSDIQAEGDSAIELSQRLSGHALAISHMAGLIHRRSWSITEFMRIYSKNPRRVHQSELQAVWDLSFSALGQDSQAFLGIASFLVSENIPQLLFDFEDSNHPEGLEFCTDEFRFSEAIEPLLTLALIKRDRDARLFSCHRMVQTQFRYFLSLDERQKAFANATALVHRAFPKQSDETNQNQLYREWAECNRYLQHVISLVDRFQEERRAMKNFKAPSLFCDLLKDCQRYLYEINALKDLEDVCGVTMLAVEALEDEEKATDIAAWTLSLQASMYESTGKVQKAIELNTKGYEMRLKEKPLKGGLLGGFEQNLGYNYNTANDHETALTWLEKSKNTWIAWNVSEGSGTDWPTLTKKNTARCLVYLGQYDQAQELLDIAIAEFRQEKPLNWAMLAYAYFVLGILERRRNRPEAAEASFIEAQNLWLGGDQTRLHPFNAGCLYKMGVVCLDQGKVEAAVKHLRESLHITKFHVNMMPAEHARGLFKLSEALLQDSYDDDQARGLRDEAEFYLLKRDPLAVEFGKEEYYDQWIPIFWR